jgi:hypothetical protein
MVTIRRRVSGVFRYRKAWFPAREELLEISRSLRWNEIVRFFAAPDDLPALPNLIARRRMRTLWVDLAGGPEKILEGMKRKSCRYEIRRAEKMLDGVTIEAGSEKSRQDFLVGYNDFAHAKHLRKLRPPWLREYLPLADTFVLYLRNEPLCCHLLIRDAARGIVRLLDSGSRRLETPKDAAACGALNRYLHWHEMQRYQVEGFVTFDFGGIREPADPISRFKLSFGGAVVTEHYYLLSRAQWVARLGNLVYEKLLRGQALASKPPERGGLVN